MCLSLGGITAAPLVYHRLWSLDYGLAAPFTTIMIFFGCHRDVSKLVFK